MTWLRRKETREGKTLSAANQAHLTAAAKHLQAVFEDADIDPDDLGGDDGTIGNPDQAAGSIVGPDATGVRYATRVAGGPAGPTMRTSTGQVVEVRD